MTAAKQMFVEAKNRHQKWNITKSLKYSDVTKKMWYYTSKPRNVKLDQATLQTVQQISYERPTYGTRRMAAQVTRQTGIPTNRKNTQRIYRKTGIIESKKKKKEIIRSSRKLFKPNAPHQLWETDITYIPCGVDGWCYSFNIIDTFTRKWLSYVFSPTAHTDSARVTGKCSICRKTRLL